MPRVPTYEGRTVRQTPGQQMSVSSTATSDNFGQGLIDAGGQALAQYKERTDQAALMKADNSLSEWENNYLYDPQQGALTKEGENAFNLQGETDQQFNKKLSEAMSYLQNDDQRRAFNKLAMQRRQQVSRTVAGHVRQQVDAFEQQQATAVMENSRNMAANNFNSPERINVELARQRGVILSRAKSMGWSDDVTQQAMRESRSATLASVLERKMAANPGEALQYYAAHKADFTPQQQASMDEGIRKQTVSVQGRQIADNVYGGGTGGPDSVWEKMVHRESRGKQFGSDGQPLTSSAGAVGVAQVMPDTAKEAAGMAGLEWDEERYKNDPAYNMAIGRAYYDGMVQRFGDPVLAAAAYNAGPGRVQEWLKEFGDPRKGEISKAEFIQKIPFKETRNYVADLEPDRQPATRAQQLESLNSLPPDVRDVADTQLRQKFALEDMQKKEVFENAQNAIEGGQGFDTLPVSVTRQLDNKQMNALKDRAKQIQTKQPVQNWQAWTSISQMDRSELAAVDDPYTEFRPKLDDAHYEKALTLWNEANGKADKPTPTSSTLTFGQRVKNSAMTAGVVPADKTPAKYSEDESLAYARFEGEAASRIEQAELQAGKKLTGDEQQKVLDDMLLEKVSLKTGWIGSKDTYAWAVDADDQGDVFVPFTDIPENERTAISNLMRSNGVNPDNKLVEKAYGAFKIKDMERADAIIKGAR